MSSPWALVRSHSAPSWVKVSSRTASAEADAEALERLADQRETGVAGLPRQRLEIELAGPLGCDQAADVLAVVAAVGHRLAERERTHRLAELDDLAAVVVDVVLARDVVAAQLEDPGQRVAVRRLARVPDVQRPGRVGRDELDVDRHRRIERRGAEPLALGEHVGQRVDEPLIAQVEVEKPRSGHLGTLQHPSEPRLELAGEAPGDLVRPDPQARREQQRRVGRVVAEVGARRLLELHRLDRGARDGGGAGADRVVEGFERRHGGSLRVADLGTPAGDERRPDEVVNPVGRQ